MQKNEISKAIAILRAGGLVALPTETVYGLAADASQPEAVAKIFKAKGRPADHPLIVHIADVGLLAQWAVDVPEQAFYLAKAFWPGPLTLILKKAAGVSDLVTGGQDTIGVRVPNHPVALAVLREFGGGVAAPSANRFGRISPTTADAVREELGQAVDWILDGGQCDVGVESTIVDLSGEQPIILRPGMITAQQIELVLRQHLAATKKNAPRVSGSLESHYAPVTQTLLLSKDDIQLLLNNQHENNFMVVATSEFATSSENKIVEMPQTPQRYAHDMYQVLRELDKKGLRQIIIEKVSDAPEWDAIRDRLQRAAG